MSCAAVSGPGGCNNLRAFGRRVHACVCRSVEGHGTAFSEVVIKLPSRCFPHQHHMERAHPDQASLQVHACAGHSGQKREGMIHHDDAVCLVAWCLVLPARVHLQRGSLVEIVPWSRYAACVGRAPRAWSTRATADSCRDSLCQSGRQHGTAVQQ